MRRAEWIVVLAFVALVAAAVWMRFHPKPVPQWSADRVGRGLTTAALTDSVSAMHARRDWPGAVRWGAALVEREPRRSGALCDLALATHNVALVGSAGDAARKPALRNSLQRIRFEKRAIALADSSLECARNLADRLRAERSLGSFYEILGLPLEALACYEGVLERAPHDSIALARRFWVATHLVDPHATDFPVFRANMDPLLHRVRRSRRE